MLALKTLILCLLYFQLIQSHTPATLKALAVLHHERAKAIAKALNLRAQAQYNAAVAKARASSLGQFDHRFIRDSNADFPLGEQQFDPDANVEEATFYRSNDLGDDFGQFLAPTDQNQQTVHGKRESLGMGDNFEVLERALSEQHTIDTNPKHSCSIQQFGDMAQLDENDQRAVPASEEISKINYDDYRVRENVLEENMEDKYRDNEDIEKYTSYQTMRPLQKQYFDPNFEATPSGKSSDPHLQPHGFLHTHTHGHFPDVQPLQPHVQIPNSQLVTPGINLKVIQNQNALVQPQFATTTIQPGLHRAIAYHLPVVHRMGHNSGFGQTGHIPNINPEFGSHQTQMAHVTGHGGGINQVQTINVNTSPFLPRTNKFLVEPNVAGNTFSQTQIVNRDAKEPQLVGMETIEDPEMQNTARQSFFSNSEEIASTKERDAEDEKAILGTFFHMKAPKYDEYSDQSHSQDRNDIIRYIENENHRVKIMLPIAKKDAQYNQDKIYSDDIIISNNDDSFQASNGVDDYEDIRLRETNFGGEKLGNIFMDSVYMDPLPTLSENFNDVEQRQQSLKNILETEKRNIQNILQQIDENSERNVNELQRLIDVDADHRNLQHQKRFQNYYSPDSQEAEEVDISEEPLGSNRINNVEFQRMGITLPIDQRMSDYSADFHNSQQPELQTEAQEKLKNDPEADMPPTGDATLGYLFQIPERRYSDEYLRLVRSLNHTKVAKFEELLRKEKELINSLKMNAKHDEDLMLIGYIGDSLIDDLGKKMKKTGRTKREIRSKNLPINRLFIDPKTNLDIPKTLENLGAATRTAFEHDKAPLYHVRNMVGSAQDAVMATMKIPTNNFLIPSTYEIVNTKPQDNHQVGAINPSLFARNDDQSLPEKGKSGEIMDTFNRVGSAVRGSVLSGQEALGHVGEMANHARNVFYTSRYATPRLILKQIPVITREPRKKAIIITPRIFDVSEDDSRESSTLGKSQEDFIKLGQILDAVGVSNPNRNVGLEKIIIEPRSDLSDSEQFHIIKTPKFLNAFKDILGRIRVEDVENNDEDVIGNALNVLRDARATMGVNSLRDFIVKMKRELQTVFKNDMFDNRRGMNDKQNIKELKNQTPSQNKLTPQPQRNPMEFHLTKKPDEFQQQPNIEASNSASRRVGTAENLHSSINRRIAKSLAVPDQDRVGAGFFPQEILHPFMGQISELQIQQFRQENNGDEERLSDMDQIERDRNLGQILGAINPMMFERIFNETLKLKDIDDTPYSMFHHHHDGRSHGQHQVDDDANLETSMAIKGRILKPFMGHGWSKTKPEFGHFAAEDASHYKEFENLPETHDWMEILHPLLETDSDYDE